MFDANRSAPVASAGTVMANFPARLTPAHAVGTGEPRISSKALLGDARDLVIEHAGQEYRLHLTRNDKLILTK